MASVKGLLLKTMRGGEEPMGQGALPLPCSTSTRTAAVGGVIVLSFLATHVQCMSGRFCSGRLPWRSTAVTEVHQKVFGGGVA